jgi:glycosyltransferase involved in cell wall biosynthesis
VRHFEETLSALRAGPQPAMRAMGPVVVFSSPWASAADGWCIATRAYARAMHMGGVGVVLKDWRGRQAEPDAVAEVEHILREPFREGDHRLHIFSAPLAGAEFMTVIDVLTRNEGKQAYYCVFERRHIEPALIEKLNRLAGLWVQCRMNERVLKGCGAKNVELIRYPWFDDDPHLAIEPIRHEPRRFYYVGRFEPRKAPDQLLRAFMRAFRPGETELTIKTSPYEHKKPWPSAEDTLITELGEPEVRVNGWTYENWREHIRVIKGRLSADDMVQLHADHDVYVTASRGEGLELPAWSAKLSARQIITTESGGPEDFLDPNVDIKVPMLSFMPADPGYEWGPGANYIDYNLEDLIVAMQVARGSRRPGTRTWPGFEEHRAARVGKHLREWIERCAS